MSLFEDLVEELKEENLLEETVIETRSFNGRKSEPSQFQSTEDETESEDLALETAPDDIGVVHPGGRDDSLVSPETGHSGYSEDVLEGPSFQPETARREPSPLARSHSGESGREYFRRRATDEVKTLQMVDHIITRVEKEQARINSVPFDDLKVKQALHRFLQLDEEANASEVAEIEFLLLHETESWYTALTTRDKAVTVENLRCYCESAIPALSNQALIALARFYRNAPFSELVRSKFDLIITKLYTNDSEDGKRDVVLPADSLEQDILDLYKEWSSVPIYSADGGGDRDFESTALGFSDFIDEARKAHNFDELVSKDFFKRLNEYKEFANESFFAPQVVAAAIRCNVAVGNRYVDLIENENGGRRPDALTDNYGFLSDSAITEAIRKVFTAHEEDELAKAEARKKKKKARTAEAIFNVQNLSDASSAMVKKKAEWYKANKKLVIATALTVAFGLFYFFFSSYLLPSDEVVSTDVQELNLSGSEFGKYVESARISKSTAFAITNESWKKLAKPQKEEMMRKLLATGTSKGFSQVNFLDSKGRRVGFASATRLELDE